MGPDAPGTDLGSTAASLIVLEVPVQELAGPERQ